MGAHNLEFSIHFPNTKLSMSLSNADTCTRQTQTPTYTCARTLQHIWIIKFKIQAHITLSCRWKHFGVAVLKKKMSRKLQPFCSGGKSAFFAIWVATWQNQQCGCTPSEDSDQPGHRPTLIRVFAVRVKKPYVLSYPLSTQRRLWSDWADAQADLILRWAHTHFVGFVLSWLIFPHGRGENRAAHVEKACFFFFFFFFCGVCSPIFFHLTGRVANLLIILTVHNGL